MIEHMIERTEPPFAAPERAMLDAWLDFHRATLAGKCEGLTDEQLRLRSVPPSNLSLLGLVRHMADVERSWFRQKLAGETVPLCFRTVQDPDAAFNGAAPDPAGVAEAWDAWRGEVAFAEQFVTDAPDLDVAGPDPWRGAISLRWVLVHMIEEYARHNGHADLLRQKIDGRVGQ